MVVDSLHDVEVVALGQLCVRLLPQQVGRRGYYRVGLIGVPLSAQVAQSLEFVRVFLRQLGQSKLVLLDACEALWIHQLFHRLLLRARLRHQDRMPSQLNKDPGSLLPCQLLQVLGRVLACFQGLDQAENLFLVVRHAWGPCSLGLVLDRHDVGGVGHRLFLRSAAWVCEVHLVEQTKCLLP